MIECKENDAPKCTARMPPDGLTQCELPRGHGWKHECAGIVWAVREEFIASLPKNECEICHGLGYTKRLDLYGLGTVLYTCLPCADRRRKSVENMWDATTESGVFRIVATTDGVGTYPNWIARCDALPDRSALSGSARDAVDQFVRRHAPGVIVRVDAVQP